MPCDAVHVKWAQYAAFGASIVMYVLGVDLLHIIGLAGLFVFGTKYVSPDLDIDSTPYHRWGVLRVFFYPYVKLMKHRQLSHHIIFGPILVVSYFLGVMLVMCLVLNRFWLPVVEPMIDQAQDMLTQVMTLSLSAHNTMFISICVSCLLAAAAYHIIIDVIFKGDRG